MKHNKILIIGFCMIMLVDSCQDKEYEFPKAPEQVFLTEENMPPIEYFTLEEVDVPKTAQMDEFYFVYADTLLFTVQNKKPNPYMLSVYNMKTQELVAGYFTKGMGPGELLSVQCVFRKNEVFVHDGSQNKLAVLNIDSVALLGNEYNPPIILTDWSCSEFPRCVNDTLIGVNKFHFYGFGYERLPEFVKISCANDNSLKGAFPEKMEGVGAANIGQRFSYFNEHTKQYIVAWAYFPYVNIYDENFRLQKQFIGPDRCMPSLKEYEGYGVHFYKDSEYSLNYAFGCQTESYTFYFNHRFQGKMPEMPKVDCVNAEVFCFDKSLNLVRRLKQKNFSTGHFYLSYCEKSGNFYFNAKNEEGETCLYKCIFDK